MKASPIELLKLLNEPKMTFRVPVYQRNYEWKKEQVKQLFSDIIKIVESNYQKKHFLGTIVFVTEELEGLVRENILIDGQQRIITTFLLLKALHDLLQEKLESTQDQKIKEKIEEIYELYLTNKHAPEHAKLKLKPVEKDNPAFEELMNNNSTNSKIYENYLLLRNLIKDSDYSEEDVFKALVSIEIVYIQLESGENPQIVFESLNSTGLSLTEADLIRNFILMGLNYQEQTRLYKQYWIKIEKFLPNTVISDFVRDFLTMKEGVVPNKTAVYKSFKNFFYDKNFTSEEILIELQVFSSIYYKILNSKTGDYKIDNLIENINNIRSSVTYPYLMSLLYEYERSTISKSEVLESLSIVVAYIYRRSVCGMPTNALTRIFGSMLKDISLKIEEGLSYVDAVVDFLMSKTGSGMFPRDEEFYKYFTTIDLYKMSHSMAKLILYGIEEYSHKENVKIEDLTVEHIMPQTLTREWNIRLGNKALETHKLFRNTIGNLTLTMYNSEISNKDFLEKQKYYMHSNIKITRDIAEFEDWQKEQIIDRAKMLFEKAKKIWQLPQDNYQNNQEERLLPDTQYAVTDNVIVTGHTPKSIIIDNEFFSVNSWKEILIRTCNYLIDLDLDHFNSLADKTRFKNLLSHDNKIFRSPKQLNNRLYIETNYSAKDILNYVVLFLEEYEISNLVYFEIKK